jgi:hypothetical protein
MIDAESAIRCPQCHRSIDRYAGELIEFNPHNG